MFFHTGRLGEQSPFCFSFFSFSLSLSVSLLFRTTFTSRHESHMRVRALSRTPSKVPEAAPGSNVYPPFPQEKDPYLKARMHEMIQLFDLCHVPPPFLSRIWPMGWRLLGICVYTIFTRLFHLESQASIDLPTRSVYTSHFTRNHRF